LTEPAAGDQRDVVDQPARDEPNQEDAEGRIAAVQRERLLAPQHVDRTGDERANALRAFAVRSEKTDLAEQRAGAEIDAELLEMQPARLRRNTPHRLDRRAGTVPFPPEYGAAP
jgi:hypothetical protein